MSQRIEKLSMETLLAAIPVANEAVRLEDHDSELIIYLPIRQTWWMRPPFSWVLPYRKERAIALDRLGREVYRAVDGQRSVEQIVEAFAETHRLRFHEARLAVMQFLRSLADRNIVALAVTAGDDAEAAA